MLIIQMMLSRCVYSKVILAQRYHASLDKWQHTSPIANTYSLAERNLMFKRGSEKFRL